MSYHVDLGCGKLKRARIGIDRFPGEGVDHVLDLEGAWLPFEDSAVESIITHHALEHVGEGFIPLIDECYRVLEHGGLFDITVPLFPSWSAVADPDHKRWFLADGDDGFCTFDSFCGTPGDTPQNCWLASFSTPYTNARFQKVAQSATPRSPDPAAWWTPDDVRELRVTLRAVK